MLEKFDWGGIRFPGNTSEQFNNPLLKKTIPQKQTQSVEYAKQLLAENRNLAEVSAMTGIPKEQLKELTVGENTYKQLQKAYQQSAAQTDRLAKYVAVAKMTMDQFGDEGLDVVDHLWSRYNAKRV